MRPNSGCTCHSRSRYSIKSTQKGSNWSTWSRWSMITSMRALTLNTDKCWPTKWMVNTPLVKPTYSSQKLERWAEARDPLLPKTTTASRLNVTHSQTLRNLFPSQKLKGNCTFTAPSATVKKSLRRLRCKARKGRRGWVSSWGGHRNLKWRWRSRSVCWVYCSFCQCRWVVPKEESKLFWMW